MSTLLHLVTEVTDMDANSIISNPYLNARRLAVLLDKRERTLQFWREHGRGPKFETIEGRIMYRTRDVDAWLREQASGNATTTVPVSGHADERVRVTCS